ncbi:hypothetical protein TRIATDRAFT_299067 [Trichoderma atroviride IMI 206040]|uniref:Uncharacterized protein n=1 Tax=Hypocrea atroviridis (strain ATCC 20476 / IMI 206040) TaxID=452589 RepID=G9NSK0_HYPAI|nr:uncharacterized protein TRIATDRAFT_299067 [Trichoderma atroviride IMI 206040]EHK46398.1 hypothetical protein TRIATDRAFT_299067 [Trichoderma atroviride IMI 206040]
MASVLSNTPKAAIYMSLNSKQRTILSAIKDSVTESAKQNPLEWAHAAFFYELEPDH